MAGAEVDLLLDAGSELVNVKQLFVEVHERAEDFPQRLAQWFSVLKRCDFETRVIPPLGPSHLACDGAASTSRSTCEVFGVSALRTDWSDQL